MTEKRGRADKASIIYLYNDRAFLRSAWPFEVFPPTGTIPLIPSDLRAAATAFNHLPIPFFANNFFPAADLFLETTFPDLFFIRSLFFKPPTVDALLPLNTLDF